MKLDSSVVNGAEETQSRREFLRASFGIGAALCAGRVALAEPPRRQGSGEQAEESPETTDLSHPRTTGVENQPAEREDKGVMHRFNYGMDGVVPGEGKMLYWDKFVLSAGLVSFFTLVGVGIERYRLDRDPGPVTRWMKEERVFRQSGESRLDYWKKNFFGKLTRTLTEETIRCMAAAYLMTTSSGIAAVAFGSIVFYGVSRNYSLQNRGDKAIKGLPLEDMAVGLALWPIAMSQGIIGALTARACIRGVRELAYGMGVVRDKVLGTFRRNRPGK